MSSAVQNARQQLANKLGDPPVLRFPEGWQYTGSWRRAQANRAHVGPSDPLRFDVLLGRDTGELGSHHRVLFAIYDGEIRAECDCKGWQHRQWCSHVALLWWRWSRDRLTVTDADTGRSHHHPPVWVSVRET